MPTKSIDVMLSRPGIYVVIAMAGVSLCEVEDGRCFQLSLMTHERDGELEPGRWNIESIRGILGPYACRLPGDDATTDQCIDLAAALEQRRAVEIVRAVYELPIGGRDAAMPTPFQAGYCAACEEIDHRLRTEVWAHCLTPMGPDKHADSIAAAQKALAALESIVDLDGMTEGGPQAVTALRDALGVQLCSAEQRGPHEWVCACAKPGPTCKPAIAAGARPVDGGQP